MLDYCLLSFKVLWHFWERISVSHMKDLYLHLLSVKIAYGWDSLSLLRACNVIYPPFSYRKNQILHPFVNSMGLASGLIRVQLFLAVQNHSFCYLILKIGVFYHIILIMNTLVCSANSFTIYCTLLFFLLTRSLTHRLTSALKKKVVSLMVTVL